MVAINCIFSTLRHPEKIDLLDHLGAEDARAQIADA